MAKKFQVNTLLLSGQSVTASGNNLYLNGNNIAGNTGILTGSFYPLNSNPAGYITSFVAGGGVTGYSVTGSPSVTGILNINTGSGISVILSGHTITFGINSTNLTTLTGAGSVSVISSGNFLFFSGSSSGNAGDTGILTGEFYPLRSNPSGYLTSLGSGVAGGGVTGYSVTGSSSVTGMLNFLSGSGLSMILSGNSVTLGIQANSLTTITGIGNVNVVSSGNYLFVSGRDGPVIFDTTEAEPNQANTNTLFLYAKPIAGRAMLKQVGQAGLNTTLQPFLARNKVGYWCPQGNSTTVPGVFGFTAYTTTSGTVTARNITTTNTMTRMRRLGFVSAAGASGFAQATVNVAQITLGDGSGNGGFYKIIRFGCSDAALVTGSRQFFGIAGTILTTQPNADPATLTGLIGIGHNNNDISMKLYYGGTVAQTPISLTPTGSFPINTLSLDPYELALFSPSSSSGVCYYEVTNIASGMSCTGMLSGNSSQVPASTVLLSYSRNWRCNNGNAKAVGFDIMSDYIETDN